MATPQVFAEQVRRQATKIADDGYARLVGGFAETAFQRIVRRTPVDTGRARSNWFVIANTPAPLSIDPEDMGIDPISMGTTLAIGRAVIGAAIKARARIFTIYNNVHYIVYLEAGSSRQAPLGMVAITASELNARTTIPGRLP